MNNLHKNSSLKLCVQGTPPKTLTNSNVSESGKEAKVLDGWSHVILACWVPFPTVIN